MRARRTTALVVVWLLCALAAGAPWGLGVGGAAQAAEVRNPDGVAVIIGNRDYAGGVGEVAYAHRDAEAFRRYVVDVLGFDPRYVRVLNDASLGDMRSELGTPGHPGRLHSLVGRRRLLSDGAAVSDVVVFYSGHGMPSLNLEQAGAYLLPVDADPHDPERNGYSVDMLYEMVGALPARSVSVFLDACFTGVGGDGVQIVRGSPAAVTRLPEEVSENTIAFTAAKAQQIAYWDDEAGHGMFTHHVLDALYGGGDGDGDGAVTAKEVERYLQEHLWHAVLEKNGREQDAVLLDGTGTGATVLAAAPADGAFPARPRLDGPVPVAGGAATRDGDDDADPARIVLPDGYSVADWALLAELRLERGEHTALLVEANRHIRAHGALAPLVDIREQAVAGLVAAIRLATEAEAREALTRLARIAASAGERPELLRLEARAHRLVGDYSSEAEALARWLQAAPQSHPERRDVLLALSQARRMIAESEQFSELLGRPFSADEVEESVGWTDLHYAALLDLPAVVTVLIEGGMAADVRLKEGGTPFGGTLKRTLDALGHGEKFEEWHSDGEMPLMIAALANARQAAEALVAGGSDVNAKNNNGNTPLHWAARGNARETAEFLVARGAGIQAKNGIGESSLHLAAQNDARDTAALLLDLGADIMATDKYGNTPLHDAARWNARETAEWLVSQGADIMATDNDGNTPLHDAAQGNARETAEWLVSRGADIKATDNDGDTPLHDAARGNARETAEWLVSRGADIMATDNAGSTPLHWAAWSNARETAEWLVSRGADLKATSDNGSTPLHWAAQNNARETAEWLVSRGADLKATSDNGSTPLHWAAQNNARETAEWLVSRGADLKATNDNGDTPLHDAAWGNARETAEWLVSRGADIMATDNAGSTPLHNAARGNARETAEFLVSRGADIMATDKYGNTPLHDAAQGNARETAEWLVSQGADIMATDKYGNTPLHDAAWGNARETAEWLVSRGADLKAKNNVGNTPLHWAAQSNARETAEWLVSRGADINAKSNGGETPLDYAIRTGIGDEESRAATQALLRRLGGKTAEELK